MANYVNTYSASGAGAAYGDTGNPLGSALVREAYSREILFRAMPQMHFFRFAQVRTELVDQPGVTINMPTYRNIARGTQLTEGVAIATQAMSAYNKQIVVAEHGTSIAFTELAMRASFDDLMQTAILQLSRSVALTFDCDLRDVAMAGATIDTLTTPFIYGRADKNAAKVSQKADVAASNILSVASIKDALELLATANCPKFDNAYFVALVHPHQSRTLRDDPSWVNVQNYATPENMLTGEIGRIDNVRFLETTLMPNGACATTDDAYSADLANAGKDGIDLYQAIVMGENYYGMAIGLPVELRDDGIHDHGREHKIAWYSIYGCAVLNPERAVVITTA